jgi:APA family basic amino acid/polyamine antiporter
MEETGQLVRRLTLPYLVLCGLGTIVGAGIYVLIGKVAGRAGMYAPVSFLLAAMLALSAAAAYAEMSSRFPKTAAETVFVRQGLGVVPLAIAAGICVLVTAVVSSAALAVGFAGYFRGLVALPHAVLVVSVLTLLVALAIWGIKESALASAVITCIEVGGLVLVVVAGAGELRNLPERLPDMVPGFEAGAWFGIVGGIFLAFFAYIGFEDMVNVAEEVEDAPRTMPRAIGITMALAITLYLAVAVVSVLAVPLADLARSEAPLVLVFEHATGWDGRALTVIGSFAVVNGILVQIIMASRVLLGMSRQGWLPGWLAEVNPRTHTPVVATVLVGVAVLALALTTDIETLAQSTTVFTLSVFTLVNAALWRLKGRNPSPPPGGIELPRWVPGLGAMVSAVFSVLTALDLAGAL